MLILIDYNYLYCFIDIKSLSSRQVRWAQKLSRYYFRINYHQDKVNVGIDALSRFPQKSQNEKDKLQAENSQIFHCLQNLLINASLAELSFLSSLPSHLHQILICRTYILLQLHHFQNGLQKELASKDHYKASIGSIRLRLQEFESEDKQVRKLKAEQPVKNWQDIKDLLHYQSLPYISKVIRIELISRHHNNLLAGHYGIEIIQDLVVQKYY